MDIISSVPVEIAHKIFTYLSAEDLANCSSVSTRWDDLTNFDILWRKFSVHEEHTVLPKLRENDRTCLHKAWYLRRALSLKKWLTKTYWIHYCMPNTCNVLTGNGAILIEAYGTRLNVYDLNNGEHNLVNVSFVSEPTVLFTQNCSAWSSNSVVAFQTEWSGLLYCYIWERGALNFIDAVYGRYTDWGTIGLGSLKQNGMPEMRVASIVKWDRLLIEANHLIMPQGKLKIFIWSLFKRRCVATLTDFPYGGFCNIFTNRNLLYVCCYQEMSVYDLTGDCKATINYDIVQFMIFDCYLFFNNTTILASFTGGTMMHAAWDLKLNVLAKPFDIDGIGMLHPTLPAVCLIQNDQTELLAKRFVAIDVRTKAILWQTELFHCSRIFTKFIPHMNYVILNQKYMAYFCSTETSEPGCFRSWLLLDLEKGNIVARCTLPFKSHLARPVHCGNKAVIYETTERSHMIFVYT